MRMKIRLFSMYGAAIAASLVVLPRVALARDVNPSATVAPAMTIAQSVPFQSLQPIPDRDEADVLLQTGLDYQRRAQPAKAIEVWEEALDIYTDLFEFESMGRVYGYLGPAYVATGQYDRAEVAFAQQVSIARRRDDAITLVYGLNNLGVVLLQGNAIDEAESFFTQALMEAETIANPKMMAISLNNLGLIAAARQDFYQAIVRYETALKWRWKADDSTGEATTYNNLGDAYWAVDDYDNTIGAYGAALNVARASLDFENQFRAIDGLVLAHQNVGRFFRAQELLEERLEIARREENAAEELQALRRFASLYTIAGSYDEAIRFYQGAIMMARDLGDRAIELRLIDELTQIQMVSRN
jgi:tetratricopeptide (TPR) repeat protein